MNDKQRLSQLIKELDIDELLKTLRFPRFFEVETVNTCNARCRMCTIADWANKGPSLMPQEIWDKFVNEISDHTDWINRINVGRDGEPLLDKLLEDKIRQLKLIHIRFVTFATNASLLDQRRCYSLLDCGLDDLMISIDGFTKETFEKIRQGLKFEEVKENCINFIKIRDKHNYKTTVRIRLVLQDQNLHELDDWFAYWKPFLKADDRVYAKPVQNWGNQLRNYLDISGKIEKKNYSSQPCTSPWSTMILKANGDIPLCSVDFKRSFFMGNIRTSTIKEIWNNQLFDKVRGILLAGKRNDLKICRECYCWDKSTIIER